MVRVNYPCYGQRSDYRYETIDKIFLPRPYYLRWKLWNLFNCTHRNSFLLLSTARDEMNIHLDTQAQQAIDDGAA